MGNLVVSLSDKDKGYSMLPNKYLTDKSLSWKAKGLLTYFLTRPPNWEIRVENIITCSSDGRDSFYTAINELLEKNFLIRTKVKGTNGQFLNNFFVAFTKPTVLAETEINDMIVKSGNLPFRTSPQSGVPTVDIATYNNNKKKNNKKDTSDEEETSKEEDTGNEEMLPVPPEIKSQIPVGTITNIIQYWCSIFKEHDELSLTTNFNIHKTLRCLLDFYSEDDLVSAMYNYFVVLKDKDKYDFRYRYSLNDFLFAGLKHGRGFKFFLDSNNPYEKFKKKELDPYKSLRDRFRPSGVEYDRLKLFDTEKRIYFGIDLSAIEDNDWADEKLYKIKKRIDKNRLRAFDVYLLQEVIAHYLYKKRDLKVIKECLKLLDEFKHLIE